MQPAVYLVAQQCLLTEGPLMHRFHLHQDRSVAHTASHRPQTIGPCWAPGPAAIQTTVPWYVSFHSDSVTASKLAPQLQFSELAQTSAPLC